MRVKKRRSTTGKKPTPPTISLVEWFFYLFMNDAMLLLMNRKNMLFDERYCKDFVNGGPKKRVQEQPFIEGQKKTFNNG